MIRQVEKKLTNVPEDDLKMPECHLCMYDEIIAFDHLANKAVIIQNIHKGDNVKQKYEELEDKAELIHLFQISFVCSRYLLLLNRYLLVKYKQTQMQSYHIYRKKYRILS